MFDFVFGLLSATSISVTVSLLLFISRNRREAAQRGAEVSAAADYASRRVKEASDACRAMTERHVDLKERFCDLERQLACERRNLSAWIQASGCGTPHLLRKKLYALERAAEASENSL